MATTVAPPHLAMQSQEATWDRARWEQWPADGNRYEVICGYLYMSTAPSAFHQWIVQRLYLSLHAQLDAKGVGTTFVSPIGVFMAGCDPVQPDLLVVRSGNSGIFREGRVLGVPDLLVEVVSPSNPSYDLRTKREAYARAGVPEYWMVRPATRDVLICTQPDPTLGDYAESKLFGEGSVLSSPALPLRTAVSSLFAGAPDTTL